MDITQLILDDHHEQRRLFAMIDQIDPAHPGLGAVWRRLESFLHVHAEAEERFFYPALVLVGRGAGGKKSAAAETKDAIKDHNKLRQALAKVATKRVGSDEWYAAVTNARVENSEHMAEEEREGLADFRARAALTMRHELAVSFAVFEAEHALGVKPVDKDPRQFITGHSLE